MLLALLIAPPADAGEHVGRVTFEGLPVPGATITSTRGERHLTTAADEDGRYIFSDLTEGAWTIRVEMSGFATVTQEVMVGPDVGIMNWTLTLLSFAAFARERDLQRETRWTATTGSG